MADPLKAANELCNASIYLYLLSMPGGTSEVLRSIRRDWSTRGSAEILGDGETFVFKAESSLTEKII